jgi:hypothetical protein
VLPLVEILARHVIFGHLMGLDRRKFALIGAFHAEHELRLKKLAFLHQFLDTLGPRLCGVR